MARVQISTFTLRRVVRETGVSPADIAKYVGVPRVTVSHWLCGRVRSCEPEQLRKLGSFLGVPPSSLTITTLALQHGTKRLQEVVSEAKGFVSSEYHLGLDYVLKLLDPDLEVPFPSLNGALEALRGIKDWPTPCAVAIGEACYQTSEPVAHQTSVTKGPGGMWDSVRPMGQGEALTPTEMRRMKKNFYSLVGIHHLPNRSAVQKAKNTMKDQEKQGGSDDVR